MIHWTLSISIFHSPSNSSPTANYPFLTPPSRPIAKNSCSTTCRKPTHTDRYLYFHSHHETKHKISTAETLLHRALNLPNTQVRKTHETAGVCATLHSNGYPVTIAADVKRKKARPPPPTPTPEELVGTFFTTVFVDTWLWKTKHPWKHFQNCRQFYLLSTDRIKIHQSQPLVWSSDLLFVMVVGCDWWISIQYVNNM